MAVRAWVVTCWRHIFWDIPSRMEGDDPLGNATMAAVWSMSGVRSAPDSEVQSHPVE